MEQREAEHLCEVFRRNPGYAGIWKCAHEVARLKVEAGNKQLDDDDRQRLKAAETSTSYRIRCARGIAAALLPAEPALSEAQSAVLSALKHAAGICELQRADLRSFVDKTFDLKPATRHRLADDLIRSAATSAKNLADLAKAARAFA